MVKNSKALKIMGLSNQVYLTNDLMKFVILGWAGIFWHRLSTNQIVRCFKLKKFKSYMRYHVDSLLPLKLQKISCYFGLCRKILLANQLAGFFTFDLFDLLILILGGQLLYCTCSYCCCYYCCNYYYYYCPLFKFSQNLCK